MAALAPFLEFRSTDLDEGVGHAWVAGVTGEEGPPPVGEDRASESRGMAEQIAERNQQLAGEAVISDDLRYFVDELADELVDLPEGTPLRVDPYFLLAAQRALIGSLRALDSDDPAYARRQMRVRLEQLRQVYRDLAEGEVVYGERPPKEVAQWLVTVLEVAQARLAELVGVSPRTFQRWVSETDRVSPEGEDARRLRIIAAAANHLRHVLTGPGVVGWFEQPSQALDGRRPIDLLADPIEAPRISTLAASARSFTAA
jgi:putative toxin-antitoxin system antitoxin component (TIGR02293 family)